MADGRATTHNDPVIEGGEKVTTHWWVAAPINQFVYHVFVVRQHEPVQDREDGDQWADWQEYLDADGAWHPIGQGALCEPALTISQRLIMAMGEHGPLGRESVAAGLEALASMIFKRVERDG